MTDPLLALLQAKYAPRPWLHDLFHQQRESLLSPAKRKAILCSRRSGKTVLAAAGLADALEAADFDEAVVYGARTRAAAKRLIWGKLHKLARDHGRTWKFSESELTVTNERGGFILVVGLDKPAEIEKLRGVKLRRVILDEPATYAAILQQLYDEILEPACADLDGDIWLIGTPGKVLAGFWYDASDGDHESSFGDWERRTWTMFDNPHMRDPHAFLERVLERKGWEESEPTVQIEYFGRWTPDDRAQVYRYLASRNDVVDLPRGYRADKWVHTVCCDFGVVDDFAWTVLASHPYERTIYVIENGAMVGALVDEMADALLRAVQGRNVHVLAGDPGGGGKSLIEQWNRRYSERAGGMVMLAAEKTEKRAHIDLLNTELRTARLVLVQPACNLLGAEITVLPWADEKRLKEHPRYPNNRADSLLYAFRHHYAYMHSRPDAPPSVQAPDSKARIAHEEETLARDRSSEWWDASPLASQNSPRRPSRTSSRALRRSLRPCASWARRASVTALERSHSASRLRSPSRPSVSSPRARLPRSRVTSARSSTSFAGSSACSRSIHSAQRSPLTRRRRLTA